MKRRISRRFRPTMTGELDQLESRQLLSSGFQVVSSPAITESTPSAVSAVSPTDNWAVGDQGSGPTTLAENLNGTSWSVVAKPNPAGATFAALNGVSALSSNAVWTNEGDTLRCCGKMPSLRRAGLPGSFNLPRQL